MKKQQNKAPPPAQQKRLQEQIGDLFAQIKDQNNQNFYMRFYNQQESFLYVPEILTQKQRPRKVQLKFNKHISQVLNSLYILNGFVRDNSKPCSFLANGKDIYSKKKEYWSQFLNMQEFSCISNCFKCLNPQHQDVLKFSIFAISNILLKLGINMSKLSMILVQKRHTSNYLSIPTLSVLILEYLSYILFLGKGISKEDQIKQHDFLRQLPRITYIKICKYENKQDFQMMYKTQYHFFKLQTPNRQLKNVQYLQLFQESRKASYKPQQNHKQKYNYRYIHSQNIKAQYGISAPFSFQILYLFRYIYFDLINAFRPDLIFFVEEYPSDQKVMQARIRGLLITQLMEKVGNRIFLMKEVGMYESYQLVEQQKILNQQSIQRKSSQMIEQKSQMDVQIQNQQISYANIFPLTPQKQNQLSQQQKQFSIRLQQQHNYLPSQTLANSKLQKIKSTLLQDISYSSLSLIQRTSFEQVGFQSRKHKYSKIFVQNVFKNLQTRIQFWNGKNQELQKKLTLSKSNVETMLKAMSIMQTPERVFCMYQPYYDYIYNLKLDKKQKLLYRQDKNINSEGQTQGNLLTFTYLPEDYIYVHYTNNSIVVLMTNFNSFQIIARKFQESQVQTERQKKRKKEAEMKQKQSNQMQMQREGQSKEQFTKQTLQIGPMYELILEGEFPKEIKTKNSIYVGAGSYMYKGFGVKENGQGGEIYRIKYDSFAPKWEIVSNQAKVIQNNNLKTIPLQRKIHGYGMYNEKDDTVIFMGGYAIGCGNQQFISKKIHVVKMDQSNVFCLGKTTNQIFVGAKNGKDRIPLYPFIYGFPFFIENDKNIKVAILNTNGYMDNLPNNNRILLTQFKLSQNNQLIKTGVIAQHRMKYVADKSTQMLQDQPDEVDEEAICNRDQLLYYMTQSMNLVNRYQNRCVFQTLEEGPIVVDLQFNQKQKFAFKVSIRASDPQTSEFDQIQLKFGNPNLQNKQSKPTSQLSQLNKPEK